MQEILEGFDLIKARCLMKFIGDSKFSIKIGKSLDHFYKADLTKTILERNLNLNHP